MTNCWNNRNTLRLQACKYFTFSAPLETGGKGKDGRVKIATRKYLKKAIALVNKLEKTLDELPIIDIQDFRNLYQSPFDPAKHLVGDGALFGAFSPDGDAAVGEIYVVYFEGG